MLKLSRFFWLFCAVFLLTLWLTSSAYGISDGMSGDKTVHVEAAEPPKAPSATFYGRAIGDVAPGDLFYIDNSDNAQDIAVKLYITNAHELTHYLRYLILEVGIYFEGSDGRWQKASSWKSQPVPDTFITLRNSPVSFILPGYTKYKVSVDDGSFYCLTTSGGISPQQFYLTVETM